MSTSLIVLGWVRLRPNLKLRVFIALLTAQLFVLLQYLLTLQMFNVALHQTNTSIFIITES